MIDTHQMPSAGVHAQDSTVSSGQSPVSPEAAFFFASVAASRMPMVVSDPRLPDNPIIFTNDAFLEMTGYRRDEVVEELLADLSTACDRVVLARRFANDSVVAARRVRRGAVVRLAHLAGRAPLPRTFDVDDEPPALGPRAGDRRGARAAGQEGAA